MIAIAINRLRKSLMFFKKLQDFSVQSKQLALIAAFVVLLCMGCQSNSYLLEPHIPYTPPPRFIESLPSPFTPLSLQERSQDWGKELSIGRSFAREKDLYRAITCFKRALFLLPKDHKRKCEIEYDIFLAYYMGGKYQEAIDVFDGGSLLEVPLDFSPFQDFLVALYDSYNQIGQTEKACQILSLITSTSEEKAFGLVLGNAIIDANFPLIAQTAPFHPAGEEVSAFISDFQYCAKSAKKAQALNAILPGAGYYYVGQKKAAATSFVINALFIAAAYQLFHKGYIAAGIITTSLEAGWYFGGINGAGLAAKEYNERLYESRAKETMTKGRLFPILMIEKGF